MKEILSIKTLIFLCCLLFISSVAVADEAKPPVRVLVWSEGTEPASVYPDGIRGAIASIFKDRQDVVARTATLTDPEQGLSEDTLKNTDVLIWWGHQKHGDVTNENKGRIIKRVENDGMGLIALHSAHWSKPFVAAMCDRTNEDALKTLPASKRATIAKVYGFQEPYVAPKRDEPLTPSFKMETIGNGQEALRITYPICCFPAWRADGKPSHVRTLMPAHPIAKGIPAQFDISQTEMYDEPFHVPKPDAVIFEERWDAGEHFRSGCVWQIGQGRVFYFRPGHETYPAYFND